MNFEYDVRPKLDEKYRKMLNNKEKAIFNEISISCNFEEKCKNLPNFLVSEASKNREFIKKVDFLKAEQRDKINKIKLELEAKRRAEAERLEKIRLEEEAKRRAEAERLEKIRLEEEAKRRAEAERLEKIRLEEEAKRRAEAERLEKIRLEEEAKRRAEAERLERKKRKINFIEMPFQIIVFIGSIAISNLFLFNSFTNFSSIIDLLLLIYSIFNIYLFIDRIKKYKDLNHLLFFRIVSIVCFIITMIIALFGFIFISNKLEATTALIFVLKI